MWELSRQRAKEKNLQSSNSVISITGDVKPSTRIHQRWIPALQDIVRVFYSSSQCIQSIPCNSKTKKICLTNSKFQAKKKNSVSWKSRSLDQRFFSFYLLGLHFLLLTDEGGEDEKESRTPFEKLLAEEKVVFPFLSFFLWVSSSFVYNAYREAGISNVAAVNSTGRGKECNGVLTNFIEPIKNS